MKKICYSFLLCSLFFTSAHAKSSEEDAECIASSCNFSDRYKKSCIPAWLARTEFDFDIESNTKPIWLLETIQPIYQTDRSWTNTFFWQARASHHGNDETFNLGLGYRRLLRNNTWLFGINCFYDISRRHTHQRIGAGAEALGSYFTFRTNYYQHLTGTKITSIRNSVATTERALTGVDGEMETPFPYLPWVRFAAGGFHYEGHNQKDYNGFDLLLRMNLVGFFSVEAGYLHDNYKHDDAFVKLMLSFGRQCGIEYTLKGTPYTKKAFISRDVSRHTLDKVLRHNEIVLEKNQGNGEEGGGIIIGRGN